MATNKTTTANEPQVANVLPTKEQTEQNLAVAAARTKKSDNKEAMVIASNEIERVNQAMESLSKRVDEHNALLDRLFEAVKRHEEDATMTAGAIATLAKGQEIQGAKLNAIEQSIGFATATIDALQKTNERLIARLDQLDEQYERVDERMSRSLTRQERKAARIATHKAWAEEDRRCPHCFGEKTVTVGGETKECPKCKGSGERGRLGRIGVAVRNALAHPITEAFFRGAAIVAGSVAGVETYRHYRGSSKSSVGSAEVIEMKPAA
jgi:hypothetical protein